MKNLLIILGVALVVSSCTASKEATAGRQEQRKEKKLAEQTAIKQAVESRRYIIKVNRIYFSRGGYAELIPSVNYIIVDGEIASVSLGYMGRSYGGRNITGINFNGHTISYKLVSSETKGNFEVQMKVAKGNDTFDFYITIAPSGSCSFSVNNQLIQSVNYRGNIFPVTVANNQPVKKDQSN